jgi:hypothetical protein
MAIDLRPLRAAGLVAKVTAVAMAAPKPEVMFG